MPVLPNVTVSAALNLRESGLRVRASALRANPAECSRAAPAVHAVRRRNSRRFMAPPKYLLPQDGTPIRDVRCANRLSNGEAFYLSGEATVLFSVGEGSRASRDKFDRISDSTCVHTAGSHSIWMCGFMKTRSYHGYWPHVSGFDLYSDRKLPRMRVREGLAARIRGWP